MSGTGIPASGDAVGVRLRRLVVAMLALLILIGVAGVAAVDVATGQVSKLTKGYAPASDTHTSALTLMLDGETAIRGYLITGNNSFLQPYLDARSKILPSLDRTRVALNGAGVHSLDGAIGSERKSAAQWLSSYAEPIASRRPGASAPDLNQQQAGKALFDRFRAANSAVNTTLTSNRNRLRSQANRLHSFAIPLLILATLIAVLIAATLAIRTSLGISRPLRALRTVVSRLDRGDLTARANDQAGPSEVRALARAVNAVGRRARTEAAEDRDAEQFRQRTRLVSSTIRRTTNGQQMAEHLVRGLGSAFEVDRVWLHTFADERVPRLSAQWHAEQLAPLPAPLDAQVEAAMELANRLWTNGDIISIDDHRSYQPTSAGRTAFRVAQAVGAGASLVVPIGDSSSALGLLWVSMSGHSRHWTLTETGVAQHLAADLAHSLVQAHVIERQAQAVQLLSELDQAKADFISTVSHELRTPLTSISGYLEMLADGEAGDLPEPASQMLAVIDRNATRLRNLIEDLLTQSRIDAGRLRLDVTTVDVGAVLNAVYTSMLPLAASSYVKLKLASPPQDDLSIEADPQQLEQVFTNLLSNAIKFTPSGGLVSIDIELDGSEGVLVQVCDSGMGIPEAEFGKLFTRFFRASNASAAALPGTGLGLAIVQEIVHRHSGMIDVESQVGVGSTFSVWLPKQLPAPEA